MENKELQTLQEETSEVLSLSNSLSVENAETLSDGIDFLARVKTIGKRIKKEKDEILDPFKVALKNAQKRFKPAETSYAEAEGIVKEKIKTYTGELEDKGEDFCFDGKEAKISIRKLTKVVIVDSEKIPEKYLTQVPNENLIKETILSGEEVPGAKIEINRNIASLSL